MEPLITKTDTYSFGFYRKLIENIKQTKDMQDPDCDETNHVSKLRILSYGSNVYHITDACMTSGMGGGVRGVYLLSEWVLGHCFMIVFFLTLVV